MSRMVTIILLLGLVLTVPKVWGQTMGLDTMLVLPLDDFNEQDTFTVNVPDSLCKAGLVLPLAFTIKDKTAIYEIQKQRFANGMGYVEVDKKRNKEPAQFLEATHNPKVYWRIIVPKVDCSLHPSIVWDLKLSYTICDKKNFKRKKIKKVIPIQLHY